MMSWKDAPHLHLRFTALTVNAEGHASPVPLPDNHTGVVGLILNVETMVQDLTALFAETEQRLLADPILVETLTRRAREIPQEDSKRPAGSAMEAWTTLIALRRWAGE